MSISTPVPTGSPFTKAWWLGMAERVGTTFVFAFGSALVVDGFVPGATTLGGINWKQDLSIAAAATIFSLVKAVLTPGFTSGAAGQAAAAHAHVALITQAASTANPSNVLPVAPPSLSAEPEDAPAKHSV